MNYTYRHPRPALTADCAVFCPQNGDWRLLLIQRARPPFLGQWALPGGFVDVGEDLPDAARRELEEETGLEVERLEQVGAFGAPDRDPREHVVSIAFLAIVAPECIPLARAGDDAGQVKWFSIHDLPPLAFDHHQIVRQARARLRDRLEKESRDKATHGWLDGFSPSDRRRLIEVL